MLSSYDKEFYEIRINVLKNERNTLEDLNDFLYYNQSNSKNLSVVMYCIEESNRIVKRLDEIDEEIEMLQSVRFNINE